MIEFIEIEGKPDAAMLEKIRRFYASIFGRVRFGKFERRIDESVKLFTVLALDGKKPVGFKPGHQIEAKTFYSRIGGVDEDFRRQ